MSTKKYIFLFFILFPSFFLQAQNNTGTPYSMYGLGLLQDNYGPYSGMGGISAAMRDANNINFLNPASYTALDSNRFYLQFGITGEYVHISTHRESGNYRVAQNAALNMAFRVYKNLYASLGFNQRSDIGYDLYFNNEIYGSKNQYFDQQISGTGGLNEVYLGLAYKFGNLSLGLNTSLIFGNLEKRLFLYPDVEDSFYIHTRTKTFVNNVLFCGGVQYKINLSPHASLVLGSAFNLQTDFYAKKEFEGYKINATTSNQEVLSSDVDEKGSIVYPFRITSGISYLFKDKWNIAGDYTFQQMSKYKEFKEDMELQDYHKGNFGLSLTPAKYGRSWWKRNAYTMGIYGVRSHLKLNDKYINTLGLTLGTQMPLHVFNQELLLGLAFDLGIRGLQQKGLIQEKYAKLRVNIAFKEGWFAKRKIK